MQAAFNWLKLASLPDILYIAYRIGKKSGTDCLTGFYAGFFLMYFKPAALPVLSPLCYSKCIANLRNVNPVNCFH